MIHWRKRRPSPRTGPGRNGKVIILEFYGTIGPACADELTLRQMVEAGMTGLRFNLSHGSLAEHKTWLDLAHAAGIHQIPDRPARAGAAHWAAGTADAAGRRRCPSSGGRGRALPRCFVLCACAWTGAAAGRWTAAAPGRSSGPRRAGLYGAAGRHPAKPQKHRRTRGRHPLPYPYRRRPGKPSGCPAMRSDRGHAALCAGRRGSAHPAPGSG